MLENCKNASERWGGVSKIVDKWLDQRQQLIVEFCTISGVHALDGNDDVDHARGLKHFCELLVDYISAGHFEVYDHLIQEAEEYEDGSALELAKNIYPQLSETTEVALAFNDDIDALASQESFDPALARKLSKLGESLVNRFELEDQLVNRLHLAHRDTAASL